MPDFSRANQTCSGLQGVDACYRTKFFRASFRVPTSLRPPRWRYNSCPRWAMGLYSHYDGAHHHPLNRVLHMIAIPVGFSSLIVVWYQWIIGLLLIPLAFAL